MSEFRNLVTATDWTNEKPTAQFQWLERSGHPPVLQQYWSITTIKDKVVQGMHGEWRDVPTVKEP